MSDDGLAMRVYDWERKAVSEGDWRRWQEQRASAKQRGIAFRFSPLDWSSWWRRELAAKGATASRGRNRAQFMMCRIGDQGAYEEGNVYCGTQANNAADTGLHYDRAVAMKVRHAAKPESCWLRGTIGAAHPKSRAVIGPDGMTYPSATAAAKAHGWTRQYVGQLARWRMKGWRYARRAP